MSSSGTYWNPLQYFAYQAHLAAIRDHQAFSQENASHATGTPSAPTTESDSLSDSSTHSGSVRYGAQPEEREGLLRESGTEDSSQHDYGSSDTDTEHRAYANGNSDSDTDEDLHSDENPEESSHAGPRNIPAPSNSENGPRDQSGDQSTDESETEIYSHSTPVFWANEFRYIISQRRYTSATYRYLQEI